jgi:hypothetical protein
VPQALPIGFADGVDEARAAMRGVDTGDAEGGARPVPFAKIAGLVTGPIRPIVEEADTGIAQGASEADIAVVVDGISLQVSPLPRC